MKRLIQLSDLAGVVGGQDVKHTAPFDMGETPATRDEVVDHRVNQWRELTGLRLR